MDERIKEVVREEGGRAGSNWTGMDGYELREAEGAGRESIYQWEHGAAVEPWPEAVDGKMLLDKLEQELRRFVVLGKWAPECMALWVLHTYAFQLRQVATYIGVESPEKRCGKTTLLTVLCELVNRPVVASNISSPAFFRVIEEKAPTLLIDEADTVLHRNKELKGILNAGYAKKTAYVIRMTSQRGQRGMGLAGQAGREKGGTGEDGVWSLAGGNSGDGSREEHVGTAEGVGEEVGQEGGIRLSRFSCWCPKVIATIKHLPETLGDRCIVIQMQRKTGQERCERLRKLEGAELRRKCARFVMDHAEEIAKAQPEVPEELNDRAADIWEPLLVLADLAGGDWPEKGRKAAVGLSVRAQEESPIGALLLDILILLARQTCVEGNGWMKGKDGGRMFSRDLVAGLNGQTDRPWMALRRGKQVTERWLSQQLGPYGIGPRTIWIAEVSAKGYQEADFKEAFRRYIPRSSLMAMLEEHRKPEEAGGLRSGI